VPAPLGGTGQHGREDCAGSDEGSGEGTGLGHRPGGSEVGRPGGGEVRVMVVVWSRAPYLGGVGVRGRHGGRGVRLLPDAGCRESSRLTPGEGIGSDPVQRMRSLQPYQDLRWPMGELPEADVTPVDVGGDRVSNDVFEVEAARGSLESTRAAALDDGVLAAPVNLYPA